MGNFVQHDHILTTSIMISSDSVEVLDSLIVGRRHLDAIFQLLVANLLLLAVVHNKLNFVHKMLRTLSNLICRELGCNFLTGNNPLWNTLTLV